MMLVVKDCDNKELFSAEILEYVVQEGNIFNILIPPGNYDNPPTIETTDLLRIRVTTDAINYEGYGRIFEAFPGTEGSLVRIRFDGAWDVN